MKIEQKQKRATSRGLLLERVLGSRLTAVLKLAKDTFARLILFEPARLEPVRVRVERRPRDF